MNEVKLIDLKSVRNIKELYELCDWCTETFGPTITDDQHRWTGGRWHLDGTYSFKFTHSEDAVFFKLRWI
jgi:hypothetical protein